MLTRAPIIAALACILSSASAVELPEVAERVAHMPSGHPRLLWPKDAEQGLKQQLERVPMLKDIHTAVMTNADRILGQPPVQRVLIGKRLLDKSRTCLERMTHLGYAWRMTHDRRYLDRAVSEVESVTAFSDWNPSHFLDVAEMTTAVAIAFDWFHDDLSETMRAAMQEAILAKGIVPSFAPNHFWMNGTNNWNQVCHGGMILGALALDAPEEGLVAKIITRGLNGLPHSLAVQAPDGVYPEGPGYWSYGTSYTVLIMSGLQTALGTDFSVHDTVGVMTSADFALHAVGPTGQSYNFADCGRELFGVRPPMLWFAAQRDQPWLLWADQQRSLGGRIGHDRFLPLALAWAKPGAISAPPATSWSGRGPTPVAMHRSAWTGDAVYVACKGGSPGSSHAHMDAGSFIMEADGVRWADELGMQNYESLESKHIDLWNFKQDSQRWSIFRIGASSHNILTVDGQDQRVKGAATFTVAKPNVTVIDTGPVYAGQFTAASRGVTLREDRTVLIQDEFTAVKDSTVRWAMLTPGTVEENAPGRMRLGQAGKHLTLRVLEPEGVQVQEWSTAPPHAYDVENPGTRLVGFSVTVPAGSAQRLVVQLVPGTALPEVPAPAPLSAW